MIVLYALLALPALLLIGWIMDVTLREPLAEKARRDQQREDEMLARMTKQQRRAYYRAEHHRATHGMWGL